MKVIAFPNPSGSAYWRFIDPYLHLRRLGIDAVVDEGPITEEKIQAADVIVLHSCVAKDAIALCYAYQQERGKKLVVDADDYIKIDPESPFKLQHDITDATAVITRTMEVADLITASTTFLGSQLKKINPNVVVLPNAADLGRWDIHPKLKNTSDRIRIGWTGSITHLADIEMIAAPLTRILKEFSQVELVFMGDTRIRDLFPEGRVEAMLGTTFEYYPARLNGLRLDIGLAPLQDTLFNRCRSQIKFYEYALAEIPGVYSPLYNFHKFDGQLGMVAEDLDQWYRSIKNLIIHPGLREDITRSAYAYVRANANIARKAVLWKKAYQSLFAN